MSGTTYRATWRLARISPRKVRPVADRLRGRSVEEAMRVLDGSPLRGASMVRKVLRSAVGNAEDRDPGIDSRRLIVSGIRIDMGSTLPGRWRPRARGAAYPILRRTSHITVEVAATPEEES